MKINFALLEIQIEKLKTISLSFYYQVQFFNNKPMILSFFRGLWGFFSLDCCEPSKMFENL